MSSFPLLAAAFKSKKFPLQFCHHLPHDLRVLLRPQDPIKKKTTPRIAATFIQSQARSGGEGTPPPPPLRRPAPPARPSPTFSRAPGRARAALAEPDLERAPICGELARRRRRMRGARRRKRRRSRVRGEFFFFPF